MDSSRIFDPREQPPRILEGDNAAVTRSRLEVSTRPWFRSPESTALRYGSAIAATVIAALVRAGFDPLLGERFPFVIFIAAVVFAAWYGGFGPSLLSVLLGAILTSVFYLSPRGSFAIEGPVARMGASIFMLVGLAVALMGGSMRNAQKFAEEKANEAKQRLKTEHELRERLEMTLQSIGDGVLTIDADGLVEALNPIAETLTGWSRVEAIGQPLAKVFQVLDEATGDPIRDPARLALADSSLKEFADQAALRGRDGTLRPIDDSIGPIRGSDGQTIGAVLVFRDVTRRRQDEARLRAGEEQVRLLLDSTGEAIYGLDLQGLCTFSNPACLRLLGFKTPEDLLGQPMHALIHHTRPDLTPYPVHECRIFQAIHLGEGSHVDDEVFWRSDGSSFPTEYWSFPIRRDGEIVGSVVTFIDITERTKAAATISEQTRLARFGREIGSALTQSATLNEALDRCASVTVEHLNAAFARIWTLNEAGDVLELQASAGLYTHTDGPHGRIPVGQFKIGQIAADRKPHLTNSVVGDPRVPAQDWVDREGMVAFAGYPLVVEDRLVGVMAMFSRAPLSEATLQMMASVADELGLGIERKKAEERLHRQQEWLRVTLASIGDAVIATDTDGRITLLNTVAESLTGWTQAEARGLPLEDVFRIVNETSRLAVENPAHRALREGKVVGLANHTILIDRQGHERSIDDSAAPIRDEQGTIIGSVLVFRDVDDRRRAERALEASTEQLRRNAEALEAAKEEAEDANRAKDQFLAVLSHELRTPLNPILLAATAMLERPGDPDELRPTLEMIRQNVNLQARLIDDLLDVMRIVRGKMPLHWEVADCHRLIAQAIQICRSEVFGKELQLQQELLADRHHVNADPARLQQVIWNLIKNALKFTPSGGTITIRTRNPTDESAPRDFLEISVSDTGIGIDPDVLPRIFDPFQQGETTITRKFGGLGLGLAICKGIVEAHGGIIAVESDGRDRGTTFRVALKALPRADADGLADANDGRAVEAASTSSSPLRILVVEDEPATLRLMARLLRGLGHDVVTANTITAGLSTFESGVFDLIVSDIGLPDGSGLELMRRIVGNHGKIAAIALTGYGMEEDIRRSREAGFTAHLTKPIDFTKLEAMIQQVSPLRS